MNHGIMHMYHEAQLLRGGVKRNSRKIFSISFRYIESVLSVWYNLRKKVIVSQHV